MEVTNMLLRLVNGLFRKEREEAPSLVARPSDMVRRGFPCGVSDTVVTKDCGIRFSGF